MNKITLPFHNPTAHCDIKTDTRLAQYRNLNHPSSN